MPAPGKPSSITQPCTHSISDETELQTVGTWAVGESHGERAHPEGQSRNLSLGSVFFYQHQHITAPGGAQLKLWGASGARHKVLGEGPKHWVKNPSSGCRTQALSRCALVPSKTSMHHLAPHLATRCRSRGAAGLSMQRSKRHRRHKYFQIQHCNTQNLPSPCRVCSQVLHMGTPHPCFFPLSKAGDSHHVLLMLISNPAL